MICPPTQFVLDLSGQGPVFAEPAPFGMQNADAPVVGLADAGVHLEAAVDGAQDRVLGQYDRLELFQGAGQYLGALEDGGHAGMIAVHASGNPAAQVGIGGVLEIARALDEGLGVGVEARGSLRGSGRKGHRLFHRGCPLRCTAQVPGTVR